MSTKSKKDAKRLAKTKKAVRSLEARMMKDKARLAKLRRRVPLEPMPEYSFRDWSGKSVSLASLFGKKQDLILIHNMGVSCPYCTLWADGFNGALMHLENRAAVVLESMDKTDTQKKFARSRGWKFKMVSSGGTSFRKDMGYAGKDGSPHPGVSTFRKDAKGRVYRVADAGFGPGDNFCPTWDLLDMLHKGADGWEARFRY